ncbi:DUF533 domain-containing protein [Candidatus Berkiella aquae]|uniref:Inner membrane protein YebE n=1 Tax=Candidatus Berkiella aquae TaxID=295108 RepID=A0A0Q9YLM7_9GAMM|nr:tellurite resistance TerB family protein [Candidatus Berkiella aquae]MCS5711544.1 tellurite resistance TerB family protein [Candidatus Berkiella aquae]
MMDINGLLNQFLGGNAKDSLNTLTEKAKALTEQAKQNGLGGFAGGAAAGGLLTLLLSSDKVRSLASGVLGYGGAAVLGAMAHKAYQNYQAGQSSQSLTPVTEQELTNLAPQYQPERMTTAAGEPFSLLLIKGMIAAAKADGHIDDNEQKRIFNEVEKLNLSAEHKALIFDALNQPLNVDDLTKDIHSVELASEFYLLSLLAIDPDNPAEQTYLTTLANKLKLPPDLVTHLQEQAKQGVESL